MTDGNDDRDGPKPYERRVPISEEERRYILSLKLAQQDALNELFLELGINRANAETMEQLREDLRFLRNTRVRKGIYRDLDFLNNTRTALFKAGGWFAMAIITLLATAFFWGVVLGFQKWIEVLIHGGGKTPH